MNKLNLYTALISILASITFTNAQNFEWAKSFGGNGTDWGRSITTDVNGNVYTVGMFSETVDFDPGVGVFNLSSNGGSDFFIQKLDANGNFIWAKSVGGMYNDIGASVAVDFNGNVYVTGNFVGIVDFDPGSNVVNLTSQVTDFDIFILKLTTNGDFDWAKDIGNTGDDGALSIATDPNGNIYSTGFFLGTVDFDPGTGVHNLTSAGSGSADIYILKLDASGNFVWVEQMGGAVNEAGYSITTDNNGNIYSTGSFSGTALFNGGNQSLTSAGGQDIYIHKMDTAGNFIWVKGIGGIESEIGNSITTDINGNVYSTGHFRGSVDFDPGAGTQNLVSVGNQDIYIHKLNANGDFVWARSIGGALDDRGNSIIADASGNTYTTGYFDGTADFDTGAGVQNLISTGASDIYIEKLDANGDFEWVKQMGASSSDRGFAITRDDVGNIYTTGRFALTVDFDPEVGVQNLVANVGNDVFIQKLSACENTGTDVQTACDSYTWIDGNTYTSSNNTATYALTNTAGCDSTVTLDLTINNPSLGTDTQIACDSYTWIDGNTYTTSNNTATFILNNAAGCDSTVTLDLTINNSSLGTDTQIACNSYTWIDGNTYTSSNNTATYNIIGGASNGCDSLISLNLTILNGVSGTETISECNSYTWIDGNNYTSNNNTATYTLVGGASNGCDSIVTLDLTILNAAAGTDTLIECGSYTWIDGNTYTSDNNTASFNITGGAINGCDSMVTLDLTLNTVNTNTTLSGITITSAISGANYQWLDCDNAMSVIPGETNQSFTATANGNYAVEVNENDCIDTSNCVAITTVGIIENTFGDHFIGYPNPTRGKFSIEFNQVQKSLTVQLYSISGQLIQTENFQNSSVILLELIQPNGVYFAEITDDNGKRAVLIIIKE